MRLNDWLTLAAIVLGPISAVLITLLIESLRRRKERRLYIVRLLLATRHLPADAQYNAAINLIPAEFSDEPLVMTAWRAYHERVREHHDDPARKAAHEKLVTAAQSTLIFQVMRSAGLKILSEGDIQTTAYVSEGFIYRDTLYLDSLRALPEMAATMKVQVGLTQRIVDAIPRPPREAPPVERQP